jgi:hypothetical protein
MTDQQQLLKRSVHCFLVYVVFRLVEEAGLGVFLFSWFDSSLRWVGLLLVRTWKGSVWGLGFYVAFSLLAF